MKKHFLILMLMALLPMAGWATSADLATKPTLNAGLVYNGAPQTLLTGTATLPANYLTTPGCIEYVARAYNGTTAPTAPDGDVDDAVTEFPAATNAGKYVVWYRVLADGDAYDENSAWTQIGGTFVRISPITPTITDPTVAEGLTYTGSAQKLLAAAGSSNYGTLKYSMNNATWYTYDEILALEDATNPFVGTNAGDYTVYLSVAEDESRNWLAANKTATLTIAPKSLADADVTITYTGANPIYNPDAPSTLAVADISVTLGTTPLIAATDFAIKDYKDGEGNVTNDKAGTATCNLKAGTNGNYTGGSFTFTIDQKDITGGMFAIGDVVYTGATITQADLVAAGGFSAKDGTHNLAAFDATTSTGDYTLVTTAKDATEANGATVTITGTGNYKGTQTKTFAVTKAALTVNAKAFTVVRGTTITEAMLADKYEIAGWLGDDATAETKPAITGAPTVACTVSTADAGVKDDAITISSITGMSAANYTFTAGAAADLTVDASTVTIAFKDDIAFYYKDVVPAFDNLADIKANYVDCNPAEAVTAMTIKMYDGETEVAAATELTVGKTYTLKITDKTVNANYLAPAVIADKSVTVAKLPITIQAQPQAIAYPSGEATLAKNDELVSEAYTSWTDGLVKILKADGTAWTKAGFTGVYGDVWKKDFIESLTWDGEKTAANPGVITANPKEGYDADHFDVTFTTGAVTWTGAATALTFTCVDADLDKINEYAGTTVNVKINFAARNAHRGYGESATETYPWKAEKWTTMVLPFDISVAELSQVFDYAIVNVINPDRTVISETGTEFWGKVTMKGGNGYVDATDATKNGTKLAANKPFMLKIAGDLIPTKDYDFGLRTIVAPSDLSVSADNDDKSKFVGTYTARKVTSADKAAIWFMNGNEDGWQYIGKSSSASWTIAPFEAYIDMSNVSAAARSITFNFEDIDGTVTAIQSINTDGLNKNMSSEGWYNLNGVKLQGAPTVKGIYIQNGKKVVIK